MIAAFPFGAPDGFVFGNRVSRFMEVILHLGVHRTGCATFQAFMQHNRDALEEARVALWSGAEARNQLFNGLIPKKTRVVWPEKLVRRAEGRVKLRMEQARRAGMRSVLVSDETMPGTLQGCISAKRLYPGIGERMARYASAFDGRIDRIALSIRSQDRFWASAISHDIMRGGAMPRDEDLEQISDARRGWRDVITDLACAVPGAEIRVIPYETSYANPRIVARYAAGLDVPLNGGLEWLNKSPSARELNAELKDREDGSTPLPDGTGAWSPFNEQQTAKMREKFADDMFWLADGADGLAILTEEAMPRGQGKTRFAGLLRGQDDDEQSRMDQAG